MTLVGVDVGGTFTDAVALIDGRIITAKVPSTPRDQSEGVVLASRATGVPPGNVERFVHGMTVATNALLERTGARTALVTTDGFRDLIEIARQNRPHLYDLTARRPSPLVPRDLRFTVAERVASNGAVLVPLDRGSVCRVIDRLRDRRVDAVAVCLLFSFLHPEHEREVGRMLHEALPGLHISLSFEVLPEFREYERLATTTADAYLTPVVGRYLARLQGRCRDAGLPDPEIMQSHGGTSSLASAAAHAAPLVLSGPAGGVVGAAHVANLSGYPDVITLDMGGTSCDVALVRGAKPSIAVETAVAGLPIRLPMADVHTVSAGGGSIAWADPGGALKVGPMSAGADPGPASYDLGGDRATVTDANVFLGYLPDRARLGGSVRIRAERARAAVESLAGALSMTSLDAAAGILSVANAVMARAVRAISVERGHDPREFALLAFGGAGPMHACPIAEDLGMTTILIPGAAGVLSALGLVLADRRRDYLASFLRPAHSLSTRELAEAFEPLLCRAREEMPGARIELGADLRYRGQSHELTIADVRLTRDACPGGDSVLEAVDRFQDAYEARYTYRMSGSPVEFVNLRVTAADVRLSRDACASGKPRLHGVAASGPSRMEPRRAFFGGRWIEAPVWRRAGMHAGDEVAGPAIVDLAEATCAVFPGWHGTLDAQGTLVLERADGRT